MLRAVVLVIVATTSVAAAAPSADAVERARAAVLDDSYQKAIPGHGSADAGSAGPRRDRERSIDTRDESSDFDRGPFGGIASAIMWGALVVGLALGVVWLGSELARYGGDAQLPDDAAPPVGPDLAVIERPLADAEELARRGEYREAIHTLLLRTLRELVLASAVQVPPALTSREILARVPLAPDARDALGDLVVAVEITHFGGDDATADDYARCRERFQRFARVFRGAAA